jgi:hypothetical protein
MADQKISQLTPYTSSEIIAGDLFAVVDTANSQTKNMTLEELGSSLINTTDLLSRSGGALTGDLFFPDDIKAGFGDGSDFEIYHDGTYSYVGPLKFDANGDIVDPVTINAALNVDGAITGTSLDMNGNADFGGNITLSQADSATIKRSDNTGLFSLQGGTDALSTSLVMYGNAHATLSNWTILEGDTMVFRSVDNTDFMRFIDGTGTIFNETGADLDFRIESDTNTHAFLLRGDNGYVGIGTSSPEAPLTIAAGTPSTTSIGGYDINYGVNNIVTSGRTGYLCRVGNNFTGDGDNAGFMWIYPFDNGGNVNNKVFRSATGATLVDKFWVNQVGGGYFAGNVGIGTGSPAGKLHVYGDSVPAILESSTSAGFLVFRNTTVTANEVRLGVDVSDMVFNTATVERMRINNDGVTKAQSYAETYVTLSGTTPTITCTAGNFFGLNTTGNTTFTFASAPASGTGYGFSLRLTAGGAHTLTWPASVKWPGGIAPDNPASGETNIYAFVTHDGGTTWYGMVGGEAFA